MESRASSQRFECVGRRRRAVGRSARNTHLLLQLLRSTEAPRSLLVHLGARCDAVDGHEHELPRANHREDVIDALADRFEHLALARGRGPPLGVEAWVDDPVHVEVQCIELDAVGVGPGRVGRNELPIDLDPVLLDDILYGARVALREPPACAHSHGSVSLGSVVRGEGRRGVVGVGDARLPVEGGHTHRDLEALGSESPPDPRGIRGRVNGGDGGPWLAAARVGSGGEGKVEPRFLEVLCATREI